MAVWSLGSDCPEQPCLRPQTGRMQNGGVLRTLQHIQLTEGIRGFFKCAATGSCGVKSADNHTAVSTIWTTMVNTMIGVQRQASCPFQRRLYGLNPDPALTPDLEFGS